MSTIATDNFVATPGTSLAAHISPLDGSTWTVPSGTVTISPSGSAFGANGNNLAISSGVPIGPYYAETNNYQFLSTDTGFTGAQWYYNSTTNTYYQFFMSWSGGFALYKVVNGVPTQIGSAAQTFTLATPFTAGFAMQPGATPITIYFNGTPVITSTDTSITAPGTFGLMWNNINNSGPTTGCHCTGFLATAALVAGTLSWTGSTSGSMTFGITTALGGTSPYQYVLQRGSDGVTFGTTCQTLTGQTGAAVLTDSSPSGSPAYYRVAITDSAGTPATVNSNVLSYIQPFATTTNPPANPQISLTSALATTIQAVVLTNAGSGIGRNLVANNLPYRHMGVSQLNGGGPPIWISGDWTPNTTPTPSLRFATNACAYVWPYSGVALTTVRTGNNSDRTFACEFVIESCDPTIYPFVPIMGIAQGIYTSTNPPGFTEGIGVGFLNNLGYLTWTNPVAANPLVCTDVTGTILLCPVIPGHKYRAAIAISDQSSVYTRYFLYDLTAGCEVSPQGTQYFALQGFGGPAGPNTRTLPSPFGTSGADCLILHGDAGATVRVESILLDNACWGNGLGIGNATPGSLPFSVWQSYYTNPYFMLTATVNTSGSPPLQTYLTGGDTIYVASNSATGVPANLPFVAWGDFQIVMLDNVHAILQATAPLGVPHSIATYSWYYSLTYGTNGTLAGTTSVPNYTFTFPDGQTYYLTVTATDTSSNVYTYQQYPARRRARAPLKILGGGNSLYDLGQPLSIMKGAVFAGQWLGVDVQITMQGIFSSLISDYTIGSSTVKFFYGLNTATGLPLAAAINAFDWGMICAAREKSATGVNVDMYAWQLAGNSPTAILSQYQDVAARTLAGTGVGGTAYGAAISICNFVQSTWDHEGHTLTDASNAVANQLVALMACNGTTIVGTGQGASVFSQVYPLEMFNGHPAPDVAFVEGIGLVLEALGMFAVQGYPAISNVVAPTLYGPNPLQLVEGTASSGGGSATSYNFVGIPSAPIVGTTYTVTVYLIGGTASASGVVTFGAQTGIVWGGTVSISSGGSAGTTTAEFTAIGGYSLSATHTGLGFSGDPGNQSVTATSGGGGGGGGSPTNTFTVAASPAPTPTSFTVTAPINPLLGINSVFWSTGANVQGQGSPGFVITGYNRFTNLVTTAPMPHAPSSGDTGIVG